MAYERSASKQISRHYDVPRLVAPGLGAITSSTSEKQAREEAGRAQLAKMPKGVQITANARAPVVNGKVNAAPAIASFWTQWNQQAAKVLVPFAGALNALPVSPTLKTQLRTMPLDGLFNIFDPIEDAVGRAVDRVIAQKGATQNFFGVSKNITRVQSVDTRADTSTQNLLKRLRTIDAFFVLYFTQPVELHAELVREGVNIVGNSIFDVLGAERTTAETATVAKGVTNTIQTAVAVAAYPAGAFKVSSNVVFNGVRQDVYGAKNVADVLTYYRLTPAAWLKEYDKKAAAIRITFQGMGYPAAAQDQMVVSQLGPRPSSSVAGLHGLGAAGAEEALTGALVETICATLDIPLESTVAAVIAVIVDIVIAATVAGATTAVAVVVAGGSPQSAKDAAVSSAIAEGARRGGGAAFEAGLPVFAAPPASSKPPSTALIPQPPLVATPVTAPVTSAPVSPGVAPPVPGGAPVSTNKGTSPIVLIGGALVGFVVVRALLRR